MGNWRPFFLLNNSVNLDELLKNDGCCNLREGKGRGEGRGKRGEGRGMGFRTNVFFFLEREVEGG